MGDAQRRKIAGNTQPRGMQKSRKMTRKEQRELLAELTGNSMEGAMALLTAAKYRRGLMLTRQGGKGE